MTQKEFETIIQPLALLDAQKREFITSALMGNFKKWQDGKQLNLPPVIKSGSYYDNGKCKIKGKCKYKPYHDGDCYDCSKVI
jgi:hypothetical protein